MMCWLLLCLAIAIGACHSRVMTKTTEKVALVTGAARGIGLAAVKRFLADGWHVGLLDIDGDNLKRTMSALSAPNATLQITADVSKPEQVNRAYADLTARFGRLDALVNNAGIAIFGPILETKF